MLALRHAARFTAVRLLSAGGVAEPVFVTARCAKVRADIHVTHVHNFFFFL
jgi:hypothetical protein